MQKNREEFEEQPRKRRRKRSRFGYYLYAVVMLFLTIANILAAVFLMTYVRRIEVSETTYVKESEIIDWFKGDPYTLNSIYAVAKYKIAPPVTPVYLESFEVGFSAPWALKLDVQEKEIVGCILHEENYVYFAKDGTVMIIENEKLECIPIIEGIQAEHIELYAKLTFDNEKVFSYMVNISEQVRKNDMIPDRLVWEEESMNLYFNEICVCLGKINFDEKLKELPPILEELEGKKGKLHLEHFSEMSTNISFVEAEEEGTSEKSGTMQEDVTGTTPETVPNEPETVPNAPEGSENAPEEPVAEGASTEG